MITYHHIGGRNGTYPLPLKKGPLLKDFQLILYDADTNCLDQMKTAEYDAWGKVTVFPFCIGEKTGVSNFHLNFHPTTNSLYPTNEEYKEYNIVNNPIYGEYSIGDACKHMSTIELDLYSLEDVLRRTKIPSIDFLSLDVQGAEYDILYGAKDLLEKNCIGIQLEVEFAKLYQDQKTFSDINCLMESLGFELLELGSFGRFAPISLPIGFRGSEQPLYAEAVYIKTYSKLAQNNDIELLCKGALFSLIYKKLGLCLKFLTEATKIAEENPIVPDLLYKHLLLDIWQIFLESQHIKIPKLSQLFSNEKFQNYYNLNKAPCAVNLDLKPLKEYTQQLLPQIENMKRSDTVPLEKILVKYGLDDVAEVVKQQRYFETNCFLRLSEQL